MQEVGLIIPMTSLHWYDTESYVWILLKLGLCYGKNILRDISNINMRCLYLVYKNASLDFDVVYSSTLEPGVNIYLCEIQKNVYIYHLVK
jgi:hypothetical protein